MLIIFPFSEIVKTLFLFSEILSYRTKKAPPFWRGLGELKMKLNPDCIRDLMIFLEDSLTINRKEFGCIEFSSIWKYFSTQYERDDLLYSLFQLNKGGYIVTDFSEDIIRNSYRLNTVFYITPKGHDFIAASKANDVWAKSKVILKSLGGVSLSIIESISSGIANSLIDKMITS